MGLLGPMLHRAAKSRANKQSQTMLQFHTHGLWVVGALLVFLLVIFFVCYVLLLLLDIPPFVPHFRIRLVPLEILQALIYLRENPSPTSSAT